MRTFLIIFILLIQYGCANDNYYYHNNKKITLVPSASFLNSSNTNKDLDYYQTNQGAIVGVTNKLIVKLKDAKYLDQILDEFNLVLDKILIKKLYLLKTTNKNLTLDISNRLSEKDYIEYAHPDFLKKIISK
jgi:hypothetical protein